MLTTTNHLIFWDPPALQDGTHQRHFTASYISLLERYFGDVGGNGLYNNNTQYFGSNGPITNVATFGGAVLDGSSLPSSDCNNLGGHARYSGPNCLSDQQIRNEIESAQTATPGWNRGLGDLYFLFTPDGENSCSDQPGVDGCFFNPAFPSNLFCAYHGLDPFAIGPDIVYANMPYLGTSGTGCVGRNGANDGRQPNGDPVTDAEISVVSHEQMESVTDPTGHAWHDSNGFEIGDKCAYQFGHPALDGGQANQQWNGHYYIVQEGNHSARCGLGG
jgi:hypothetical protein